MDAVVVAVGDDDHAVKFARGSGIAARRRELPAAGALRSNPEGRHAGCGVERLDSVVAGVGDMGHWRGDAAGKKGASCGAARRRELPVAGAV